MKKSKIKPENKDIVYGSFNDIETVFLPVRTAQYYAKLHSFHAKGVRFSEIFDEFPEIFYEIMDYFCSNYYDFRLPLFKETSCQKFYINLFKVLYDNYDDWSHFIGDLETDRNFSSFVEFTDFYQNEIPLNERLPLSNDLFNEDTVSFELLIEIINYEPRMDWVPDKILGKLGYKYESIHDGDFTMFPIEREDEVLKIFQDAGYDCTRNDELIAKAYGQ